MNSRERTARAIGVRRPDRCPLLHMSLLGSSRFYGSQLDDLPDYVGQPVRGPLEDLRMLDQYVFPDAGANGRFDAAAIEDAIAGNRERFIRACAGHLFEPLQWLRGTTKLRMDLYDEDRARVLEDLLERMTDYVVQTLRNWRPFRVDGIWFMADWGSNQQLLIDPQRWRAFFKPRHRGIIREIHECGWPAEMHSDGYILPVGQAGMAERSGNGPAGGSRTAEDPSLRVWTHSLKR